VAYELVTLSLLDALPISLAGGAACGLENHSGGGPAALRPGSHGDGAGRKPAAGGFEPHRGGRGIPAADGGVSAHPGASGRPGREDRKSTRLNSSHVKISY